MPVQNPVVLESKQEHTLALKMIRVALHAILPLKASTVDGKLVRLFMYMRQSMSLYLHSDNRIDGAETSWSVLSMLLLTVLCSIQTTEGSNQSPLARGMYTDQSTLECFCHFLPYFSGYNPQSQSQALFRNFS